MIDLSCRGAFGPYRLDDDGLLDIMVSKYVHPIVTIFVRSDDAGVVISVTLHSPKPYYPY